MLYKVCNEVCKLVSDVISEKLGLEDNILPQVLILAGYTNPSIGEDLFPKRKSRRNIEDFTHSI